MNKIIFWNKITIFQQMKHFNENEHINKLTYPKKFNFFIRFCHIVLKISIFCKKIITFSSSAHLMKKSTFLPKFPFFCTKLTFFHQNWYWQKHLSLFARHYFITVLGNSLICPKTDAFCIKCYFLLKETNATKNWYFSKTEDTSLRKLNISFKN